MTTEWLTTPGQCLICGGRGGWPGPEDENTLCSRCHGNGRDPQRGSDWYMDVILPIQRLQLVYGHNPTD